MKIYEELANKKNYSYLIEHAEAKDDKPLLALLERYITINQAKQRYQWIYKNNPQGQSETWLAREPIEGQIVGFTSIFARKFLVAGQSIIGGVGFDAFVQPDHRRRGIAIALHRASLKAMENGEVPFRFMCGPPTVANLEALVKAGSQIAGTLRYFSIPFTTRGLMAMLHCPTTYTEKLAKYGYLLDQLLVQLRRIFNNSGSHITVKVTENIDYRFDQVWNNLAASFPIIGLRDREYIQWRYLQNPVCCQKLVSFEYKGELLGWAVLEFAPKGCLLVDYLFPLEQKLAQAVLGALVHFVAVQGASRLTLRFNTKGLYASLFRRQGFLPGWTVEHFQVLSSDADLQPLLLEQNNWHFTNGDLNPEASPWSINTAPESIQI